MNTEYTLHGRPLKAGDKVWGVRYKEWVTVANPGVIEAIQHLYAWDEPPVIDLAAIPPPLCWIEGYPVRKGAAMMTTAGEAVQIINGTKRPDCLFCRPRYGADLYVPVSSLTFDIPSSARPMKTVTRTFWFNKYVLATSFLYPTESQAKANADCDCIGQGSFTYTVEVPE